MKPTKRSLPFDLEAAVDHLKAADPVMRRIIRKVGPLTPRRRHMAGVFETLVESIVYQQLHGKAAATIYGRLMAHFDDGKTLTPKGLLALSEKKMRAAGLSGSKTAALKDLAAKTIDGTVPPLKEARKLSDDELVERLTQVRGIGVWTAHMLLISGLRRPDVLPTGDFAVRKAFGIAYKKRGHPKPEHVAKHGERWRPYRTVASWYLWRSLDDA